MKIKHNFQLFFAALLFFSFLAATPSNRNAIYKSLNPQSLSELLAFYELYPATAEGNEALKRAWRLLDPKEEFLQEINFPLPAVQIESMIGLVNRLPGEVSNFSIQKEALESIQKVAASLDNRKLKTHGCWKDSDFVNAEGNEIDLSRGLLVALWGEGLESRQKILSYEASLDLMALQIRSRLAPHATSYEKIHAINQFIFIELGFRFPPHSIYAKNIDTYTFLPSVMDSRKGVCLGVSILYLCIAQRLGLPLEIITPPGHIFLRCRNETQVANIETTARGIDIPSEYYMGIETKQLQIRTLKETIGLAFVNQASTAWAQKKYAVAIPLYEKALLYLQDDPSTEELLAYNYLFVGKKKEGKKLLEKILLTSSAYSTSKNILLEDFLNGKTDVDGIKTIFQSVDENRLSILKKQLELISQLKKYPQFRAGILQLGITYLQLGREKEAALVLKQYQAIDSQSPLINYYLSELSLERHDYQAAWKFLSLAAFLLREQGHFPKALKDLRKILIQISPPKEKNL